MGTKCDHFYGYAWGRLLFGYWVCWLGGAICWLVSSDPVLATSLRVVVLGGVWSCGHLVNWFLHSCYSISKRWIMKRGIKMWREGRIFWGVLVFSPFENIKQEYFDIEADWLTLANVKSARACQVGGGFWSPPPIYLGSWAKLSPKVMFPWKVPSISAHLTIF